MDLGLSGRVALVTAASRGLGHGTARALSEEGASVVISSRSAERLEKAAASIPGPCLIVPADIANPQTPAMLVDAAVRRFGALHIVVGNGPGPPRGTALEVREDELRAALEVGMLSGIRLALAAVPHMRAAGWGRLCFITSSHMRQPNPQLALSATVRTGLWGWVKAAVPELFAAGITANFVLPGAHDTARTQVAARSTMVLGDAGDFGRVVAFLCSESAQFVTGVALAVDGGMTLGLV